MSGPVDQPFASSPEERKKSGVKLSTNPNALPSEFKEGTRVRMSVVIGGTMAPRIFKILKISYNEQRKVWQYQLEFREAIYSEEGKEWFDESDLKRVKNR
ncbi:uncharacterized protein K452DRAFT_320640 [Aplosporella prunicola CBS 121167]|uniref:Uncharacterized protein n=1 Tax=Aplosporella prunicola CBS 121167 TaxID=1176127 RepID=A0A6A6B6Y7_9PEZI|nr:uncharacterized protein K452DRAFT_320640 [Aplosporella prunicola CBS 121167]KAF2138995.1 hypothetical protein K452DRAFT_320640 [Aplosporella prunicola CBS 121167]